MILFDGKKVAEKILLEVKEKIGKLGEPVRLAVVAVGNDLVMQKFIAEKKKTGSAVGIDVRIYPFDGSISASELRTRLAAIVHEKKNTGIIVQLPLPRHINVQHILNAVTPRKDADVLSSRAVGDFIVGKSKIIPPVAGAVQALFEEYGIEYKKKRIVIVGAGQLVGRPIALWLLLEGASFAIVRSSTPNPEEILRVADIVISGIGKANFITADMVRDGAVVIDAGTSGSGGSIVGDVDAGSVSKKISYLASVPGGVGPVTVAVLFRNLAILGSKK